MLLVVSTDEGTMEVNYSWLPTWIGMNPTLTSEIGRDLAHRFIGRPVDDALLEEAHVAVVEWLQDRYQAVHGLDEYLNSVRKLSLS